MARIRLSGTPVDFVTRKGFEELVGVKPPKLKVATLDATLDSPHYAQWAALTNSPDPAIEKMVRDMHDQAALHNTIQALNVNAARVGVQPHAVPVAPASAPASLAAVRAQNHAAVTHQQASLLQAELDQLQTAVTQQVMGQNAGPADLGTPDPDAQTAAAMAAGQPGMLGALGKSARTGAAAMYNWSQQSPAMQAMIAGVKNKGGQVVDSFGNAVATRMAKQVTKALHAPTGQMMCCGRSAKPRHLPSSGPLPATSSSRPAEALRPEVHPRPLQPSKMLLSRTPTSWPPSATSSPNSSRKRHMRTITVTRPQRMWPLHRSKNCNERSHFRTTLV